MLGPQGMGSVNFIDSFTQYFILFAALGIPVYGIREISKVRHNQHSLNKIFSEIFFIHVFSTILFAMLYLLLGYSIPSLQKNLDLIYIGIAIMAFNVLAVEWVFIGIEKFAYLTKRTLVVRIICIILMFLLLSHQATSTYYYLTYASISILCGISNLFIVNKYVKFHFSQLQFKKHIKPLFIILSTALAVSVYILLDTIILGFIKGDVAVGYYSAAVRIVRLPFAFIGAISAVIIPQISRAYNEKKIAEVQKLLNKSFSFICIVGFPICMGLLISSSFIITSFAGHKFDNSIIALQILTPVIMLVGINSIFGAQLLTPFGKEKELLWCVLVGMFCSLVLNLILIPYLSFIGAAITNVITELLVTLLCFLFARRHIVIRFDNKILFNSFIGALMFIPLAFFIRSMHLGYRIGELLIIVLCMIFYVTYFWFFVKNQYIENMKRSLISKLPAFRG